VIGTLKIVSPLFLCLDKCEELRIMGVVVLFGGRAFSRVDIDRAKNPVSVILVKNAGVWYAARIRLQNDQSLSAEMLEDWCGGQGHLELSICEFGIPSPLPLPSAFCLLQV